MKNLSIDEVEDITGGGLSAWAIIGITAIVIFIVGVVDGYVRPLKCN